MTRRQLAYLLGFGAAMAAGAGALYTQVPEAAPVLPVLAPTDLSVEAVNRATARLSWTQPYHPKHRPVHHYLLRWSTHGPVMQRPDSGVIPDGHADFETADKMCWCTDAGVLSEQIPPGSHPRDSGATLPNIMPCPTPGAACPQVP